MGAGYRLILIALAWASLFTGCGDSDGSDVTAGVTTTSATTTTDNDEAASALRAFFAALHEGRYSEAAELYGGSYETLVSYNPMLDPRDRAALFERYCTVNGGNCLAVEDAHVKQTDASGTIRFDVRFRRDDGSLFERSPCCGEPDTGQPRSVFEYGVRASTSGFKVLDVPPYTP